MTVAKSKPAKKASKKKAEKPVKAAKTTKPAKDEIVDMTTLGKKLTSFHGVLSELEKSEADLCAALKVAREKHGKGPFVFIDHKGELPFIICKGIYQTGPQAGKERFYTRFQHLPHATPAKG